MSRSEKKRARRLRWRLMQSLTVTFVLVGDDGFIHKQHLL